MRLTAYSLALALVAVPLCGVASAAPSATPSSGAKHADVKVDAKPSAPSIKWTSLEAGVKNAEASKRYLFVSVYTDWCGYCRKLEAVTYKAPNVIAELDKNFESVRLNAEGEDFVTWKGKQLSSRALATKWGVEGYPTLLFLNRKGEIVGSFNSYVEPDLMVKLLTYISSGARERKVTFDQYLEGKS